MQRIDHEQRNMVNTEFQIMSMVPRSFGEDVQPCRSEGLLEVPLLGVESFAERENRTKESDAETTKKREERVRSILEMDACIGRIKASGAFSSWRRG
jgi:hypothetical protein